MQRHTDIPPPFLIRSRDLSGMYPTYPRAATHAGQGHRRSVLAVVGHKVKGKGGGEKTGGKKRRCRCCGGSGWDPGEPLGHVIPGLAGAARRSALFPAWTGVRPFKGSAVSTFAPTALHRTSLTRARRRHGRTGPQDPRPVTIPAPQRPPARVTEGRGSLRAHLRNAAP